MYYVARPDYIRFSISQQALWLIDINMDHDIQKAPEPLGSGAFYNGRA